MQDKKPIVFKVGSSTPVQELGTAVASTIKENPGVEVELISIGAGAANQALKGLATARGILASSSSFDLAFKPHFSDTLIDGKERTTMVLRCVNVTGR